MTEQEIRIAMWSGPRNISTAMMRSFENRPDTTVIDEPFYGHYLDKTGLNHPGREDVIASQSTDWDEIAEFLSGPIPGGKPIWYQKHMAQHNLEECDLAWTINVTNCFLIRDPKAVIASYGKRFPIENERLLGYVQQVELLAMIENNTSKTPLILDAKDILENPERMLKGFCDRIGIKFFDNMLSWSAGKRKTDGVWAPYWYNQVEESTGFKPYSEKEIKLEDGILPVYEKCLKHYQVLYGRRVTF